jgi:hypothetical protein
MNLWTPPVGIERIFKVHSLEGATTWFRSITDPIVCVKDEQRKLCHSLVEARSFFNSPETEAPIWTNQTRSLQKI